MAFGKIINNPGGGDCFYYAVADALVAGILHDEIKAPEVSKVLKNGSVQGLPGFLSELAVNYTLVALDEEQTLKKLLLKILFIQYYEGPKIDRESVEDFNEKDLEILIKGVNWKHFHQDAMKALRKLLQAYQNYYLDDSNSDTEIKKIRESIYLAADYDFCTNIADDLENNRDEFRTDEELSNSEIFNLTLIENKKKRKEKPEYYQLDKNDTYVWKKNGIKMFLNEFVDEKKWASSAQRVIIEKAIGLSIDVVNKVDRYNKKSNAICICHAQGHFEAIIAVDTKPEKLSDELSTQLHPKPIAKNVKNNPMIVFGASSFQGNFEFLGDPAENKSKEITHLEKTLQTTLKKSDNSKTIEIRSNVDDNKKYEVFVKNKTEIDKSMNKKPFMIIEDKRLLVESKNTGLDILIEAKLALETFLISRGVTDFEKEYEGPKKILSFKQGGGSDLAKEIRKLAEKEPYNKWVDVAGKSASLTKNASMSRVTVPLENRKKENAFNNAVSPIADTNNNTNTPSLQ